MKLDLNYNLSVFYNAYSTDISLQGFYIDQDSYIMMSFC